MHSAFQRGIPPAAILIFAALQTVPALLNGYPFVFSDTHAYYNAGEAALGFALEQIGGGAPEGGAGAAGDAESASRSRMEHIGAERSDLSFSRSPYYGAMLYLLFGLSPFAVVAAQALALAGVAWLTVRVLLPDRAAAAYLAAGAICAAVSPLPYFAGYLMPDVFIGLVPLGIFLLTFGWRELSAGERVLVWLLLFATLVFHTSHILLGAGLMAVTAACALWPGLRPTGRGWLAAGAALGAALTGVVVFNIVIQLAFGVAPVNPPYLTARGLEDGPVAEMIRDGCPGHDFAVCAADPVANAQSQWFLWGADGGFYATGDIATRLRLSEEDFTVFFAAAAERPLQQLSASLRNTAIQFRKFGLYEFDTRPGALGVPDADFLPPDEWPAFAQSDAAQGALPLGALSLAVYTAVIAGALALCILSIRGRLGRRTAALLLIVVVALIGNAIAGGALSHAHHRYQARLIWLVPFLASILGVYAWTVRGARSA
jgi:hypothetical protein